MPRFNKAVVFPRIDHELYRDMPLIERAVKLLRLGNRHSCVRLAMQDHRRSLHVLHILHRRMVPVLLEIVPRRFSIEEHRHVAMNIRLGIHRVKIGQSRPGRNGFELVGLRVHPKRHVAAVGPAERSEPVRFGPAPVYHRLHAAHIILVIAVAPIVLVRACEFLAPAGGAAEIRFQHQIAVGGKDLLRRVEGQQRSSGRSAVRIEQKRVLSGRFKVHRLGYDAVDFHSVLAALPFGDFGAAQCVFRQPGVVVRDRLRCAEFQIAPENFRGMLGIAPGSSRHLAIRADLA